MELSVILIVLSLVRLVRAEEGIHVVGVEGASSRLVVGEVTEFAPQIH